MAFSYKRAITIDHTKVVGNTLGTAITIPRTGWTATADSTYTTYVPAGAINGDGESDFWNSDANYPHYLAVDMQAVQRFNKVVIDASNSVNRYFTTWQIYVSDDGINWGSAIKAGTNGAPGTFTVTLDSYVEKRYIKLVGTAGSDAYMAVRGLRVVYDLEDTDHRNFTLLFSGTYAYLATEANGGKVKNASGYDIIFTSDAEGAVKLDHEIDYYDPATGKIDVWIRIPRLSSSADTVIYLWYGDSGVSTSQENKAGLWAGYTGVWHFGDGATLSVADSTATLSCTNHGVTSVAGAVGSGGGADFDAASNQYIDCGVPANLDYQAAFAVMAWVKLDTQTQYQRLLSNLQSPTYNGYEVYFGYSGGGSDIVPQLGNGGGVGSVHSGNAVGTGTWKRVHVIFNCATFNRAFDRCIDTTYDGGHSYDGGPGLRVGQSSSNLNIGRFSGAAGYYLNGAVDELRIFVGPFGPTILGGWAPTAHANESSPSTFYAVGDDSLGEGPTRADWFLFFLRYLQG